jgi:hypothetical protein
MTLDTSLRVGASKMKVLRTIAGYLRLRHDRRRWRAAAVAVAGQTSAPASSRSAGHAGRA